MNQEQNYNEKLDVAESHSDGVERNLQMILGSGNAVEALLRVIWNGLPLLYHLAFSVYHTFSALDSIDKE